MTRVLHVITSLMTGGAEITLQKLVLAMRPLGYDSTVISLSQPSRIGEELQAAGVPVVTLGSRGGLLLPSHILSLLRAARRSRPQVIHCWMYRANLIGHALARSMPESSRPALVTSVRGALDAPGHEKASVRVARRIDAWLSGAADAIVFNSSRGAAQHAAFGYCTRRAAVIPNFFDTELFRPRPDERWATRLSLGGGTAPLVALVGRFDALKDHRGFLQAARAVRMRFPESQFLLVGRGCDADNGRLVRWVDEYGLVGAVRLLGERHDVPAILGAVDLAVSSSMSEGFPNVVGEAMACGTPCVVTDVGDSRFLVGDAGLVVPPCDPAALAKAIAELIGLPEETRRGLGEKARQRVMTEFAMAPIVNRFIEVYQGCIRARGASSSALARDAAQKRA